MAHERDASRSSVSGNYGAGSWVSLLFTVCSGWEVLWLTPQAVDDHGWFGRELGPYSCIYVFVAVEDDVKVVSSRGQPGNRGASLPALLESKLNA